MAQQFQPGDPISDGTASGTVTAVVPTSRRDDPTVFFIGADGIVRSVQASLAKRPVATADNE